MKTNSIFVMLLALFFLGEYTVAWCCTKPPVRYRPYRPHSHPRQYRPYRPYRPYGPYWRGWRGRKGRYVPPCYRNGGKKVDVKNFSNKFEGTAIKSQFNFNNGGHKNVQSNSKVVKPHH